MQEQEKWQICCLGTGLMGQPMAGRLLQAGHAVQVWNRSAQKTSGLQQAGAQVASSVGAAVQGGQLIISMLSDGAAVAEVAEQALPFLQAGQIWLDMSSTRQDEAQALHARLATRGVLALDGPVSGGVIGAQQGSLAIMVGGDAAVYTKVAGILAVLGRASLVGGVGCGQLAKLCNQLIVGGTMQLVAEALLLAQAGGADAAAVRAAIRGGFAESRVLEVHGARMLERNFLPGGQIKTQAKDMHNILAAAEAAGLSLPLSQQVSAGFDALLPTYATADQAAALLGLELLNPGLRLGQAENQLP